METKRVINERFELLEVIGHGGMGQVFRSIDRQTNETVAVKTLTLPEAVNASRFAREAMLLAELEHPNIVSYIEHGTTAGGESFLAMEWLAGMDLRHYLRESGKLTFDEMLMMGKQVALALGMAHNLGIIHRDIKPSNIHLMDGNPKHIKVLDFGIARMARPHQWLTKPGTVLGSSGYMAPEQARGDPSLGAPADIFSLGCVLYQALVGERPFEADLETAVLAKILFSEAPRLSRKCPAVPKSLDNLVAQMLEKDPNDRPSDGNELASLLSQVDIRTSQAVTVTQRRPKALTHGERRVVSIVMAGADPSSTSLDTRVDDETAEVSTESTRKLDLWAELDALGARVEILANGCLVACLSDSGVPTDQAMRAAGCAQVLKTHLPNVPIVLATGHGELDGEVPTGDVIDRAVQQLSDAQPGEVRMGRLTASLIRSRFSVMPIGKDWTLGETLSRDSPFQTVLGLQTRCVGRDRELSLLRATLDAVREDQAAEAVLVTGTAGSGKSRIGFEFLLSLRLPPDSLQILMGQADSLGEGSAYSLLCSAIRHTTGIRKGESLDRQRIRFKLRLQRHLPKKDHQRVIGFLGEMVGIPFEDDEHVQLRAARRDPRLMRDQILAAWTDWLAAECREKTVILVVDDLHWGDRASVNGLLHVLEALRDQSLLVLAMARPEGETLFSSFWTNPRVTHLGLRQLSSSASKTLVQSVLGDTVEEDQIQALVERAQGNAFFLEELIRAAGEGASPLELPKTVLAMVQSRLDTLSPDARRVLRAASVFGDVFWRSGLATLLGYEKELLPSMDSWLANLQEREFIRAQPNSQFSDEIEYMFRHDLVRETAYSMLTDEDRRLGHRLAARWLEQKGEVDPEIMAHHLEHSDSKEKAVSWYQRAAEHALDNNDLDGVIRCADAGEQCGPTQHQRGYLQMLRGEALIWRSELPTANEHFGAALDSFDPQSAEWSRAAGLAVEVQMRLGHHDDALPILDHLRTVLRTKPPFLTTGIMALARAVGLLFHCGRHTLADELLSELDAMCPSDLEDEPLVAACIQTTRSRSMTREGLHAKAVPHLEEAHRCFERAGDIRNSLSMRVDRGYCLVQLGQYKEAEILLREAADMSQERRLRTLAALANNNLGMALLGQGRIAEAIVLQEDAFLAHSEGGDVRFTAGTKTYLAKCLLADNRLDEAIEAASHSIDALQDFPAMQAGSYAICSHALLAQNRHEEAMKTAQQSMTILQRLGRLNAYEWDVRLAYATALNATNDPSAAVLAVHESCNVIRERASHIDRDGLRTSFLAIEEIDQLMTLDVKWASSIDSV
jgi:serine/threonine protein kinase/tetratricopeptide (TPR) repeat protein